MVLVHPRFTEAFEQLRAWRYERAGWQAGLRRLRRQDPVAHRRPSAHPGGRAAGISGIGPVKLENYGDELIALTEKLRGG